MKAIIFSHLYSRGKEVFDDSDISFIICPERNETSFLSLQKQHQAQAVVLDSRPYSDDFFRQLLPQTLIVRFGTGTDSIPKTICNKYGHRIANTPGASTSSVCEYVFTVMGFFSQGIWAGYRAIAQQNWIRPTGRELKGQRLAVLGLGKIGLQVAKIAQSRYQMEVIGLCRKNQVSKKREEILKDWGREPTFILTDNLREAISRADFITLHLSLNTGNHYLINQETLVFCPPNAVIINTARGKHIREIDLRHALYQGKLGGVALDVFEQEPYVYSNIAQRDSLPNLIDFPNVILTPHIAGHTREANFNTATMVLKNIQAFFQKRWEDVYWVRN